MKSAANSCLSAEAPDGDGFKYLNKLRSELYASVKQRAESRTKTGQRKRSRTILKTANDKKAQAEYLNVILTKAYSELLANIHTLSYDKETTDRIKIRIDNIVERHLEVYGAILQPDLNADQVGLSVVDGGRDK
ncbi:hypothetical protein [Solemya elarraichensis gill symbiont]|nr:hypothetical protein [Solemya elarraichensis gill symbiont]